MARGKRLLAESKSKMNDVWPDLPHESDAEEPEENPIPFQIDYKLESFEQIEKIYKRSPKLNDRLT